VNENNEQPQPSLVDKLGSMFLRAVHSTGVGAGFVHAHTKPVTEAIAQRIKATTTFQSYMKGHEKGFSEETKRMLERKMRRQIKSAARMAKVGVREMCVQLGVDVQKLFGRASEAPA